MNLKNGNLSIRNAVLTDAEQLCKWWNNGEVMAHAGFPNGLGTTIERICTQIAADSGLFIIEQDGTAIGEMNYRDKGDKIASIGIKICDSTAQGKGLGTLLLTMFINELFANYGFKKIILDTNVKNKRAQRLYEKLGFKVVAVRENSWTDQIGELQSVIDYALTKEEF